MSIQRQLRRGTTAQINAMTPAAGELLQDTTRNALVLGNGSQLGGFPLPSLNAQGWVGIGTATPAAALHVVPISVSDPSASFNIVLVGAPITFSADNASEINAIAINSSVSVAATKSMTGPVTGIRIDAFVNSVSHAGSMSTQSALWARGGIINSASSGSVSAAYVIRAEMRNSIAGATVTTFAGVYVNAATIAGNGTNLYGVLVGPIPVTGTYANIYDFYGTNAGARNYFAGATQIGTTINNGVLTIGGNVMPEADNTRNLGSASFRFASSFVAQLIATAARITTAKTPATSGAAGTQGDFCWDTSYLYVCTAANTWRRAAHATW